MNQHLQAYARSFIKERLTRCSPRQLDIFKRMYSHLNLDRPVDQVVDALSPDKLSWAMDQVENTYQENVASGSAKALPSSNPVEGWREFVAIVAQFSSSIQGDGHVYCDKCGADLSDLGPHHGDCITLRAQQYLAAHEEAAPPGHTWRCRDCYGPLGEDHSENCGVGRSTITREHCGDSPIPNKVA